MIGNVNVPGASAADLANKVDKISGKGLSTNDFTTAYKNKLDNVDTTVTENSSNFVTSGAVYSAIQSSGGLQWVVPKPYNQASTRDDIFIGDSYTSRLDQYTVENNKIIINPTKDLYIWFKMSAFDLTEPYDIFDRFLFIWSGEYVGKPLKIDNVLTNSYSNGYYGMKIDGSASYSSSNAPQWNILRILKGII